MSADQFPIGVKKLAKARLRFLLAIFTYQLGVNAWAWERIYKKRVQSSKMDNKFLVLIQSIERNPSRETLSSFKYNMLSLLNQPGFDTSSTWRFVDINGRVDGSNIIIQDGREICTLTSKPKSEWKKFISSKHEAYLYPAGMDQNEQLGSVLFPDHLLTKNDIQVTMGDPTTSLHLESLRVSRVNGVSSKHSFTITWPEHPPAQFTWEKATRYGAEKLGRGSLMLKGPSQEPLVLFHATTAGSPAGRLYISPLIGDEILPLVILTYVGLCAKKARDVDDEKHTEGIIEGVFEIIGL